jgi:hypothetical protein
MFEAIPETEMSKHLRHASEICKKNGYFIEHISEPTFTSAVFQVWNEEQMAVSAERHEQIANELVDESDALSAPQVSVEIQPNGAINIRLTLQEDLTSNK